jgi:hypothetical protein
VLGCANVAVRNDGDRHRLLDGADRFVLDRSDIGAGPRASMHGERLNAGILRDAGDRKRVAMCGIGARANLERDRHIDGAHDGLDDRANQRFVGEQCGSGRRIAHLLRRAAHVDVDHLGTTRDVVLRRLRHQSRIGAGDLHGDGTYLAAMVGAPLRLLRSPEPRIRRDHLRYRIARAVPLAQLPERSIGDAGHRRDDKVVRKNVRADLHGVIEREASDRRARGADYNQSESDAERRIVIFFCARTKIIAARWHAFWNARSTSVVHHTISTCEKNAGTRTHVRRSNIFWRRFTKSTGYEIWSETRGACAIGAEISMLAAFHR